MKIIIFFLTICNITSGLIQTHYKRLSLDDTEWPGYISKTIPFKTNGNIECGAICSAQFDGGCHMYAPQKDTKSCHIGYFDNTATDYLTGQSGNQPVYLSLGIILYFYQY